MRPRLTFANVASAIAVFIALGGTALATHPGGQNTISTADIQNGEVRVADIGQGAVATDEIANNQVKAADIGDGEVKTAELANGQVKTADIGGGEVRSSNVLNENLTGGDIAGNSLKGADIDESTLTTLSGVRGGCAFGFDIGTSTNIPPDDGTSDNVPAATVASLRKECAGAVRGSFTSETSTASAGDLIHIDMRATCTATGGFSNPCTVGQQVSPSPGHTFLQNVQAGVQTHAADMIWNGLPAGVWTFEVLPGGNNKRKPPIPYVHRRGVRRGLRPARRPIYSAARGASGLLSLAVAHPVGPKAA